MNSTFSARKSFLKTTGMIVSTSSAFNVLRYDIQLLLVVHDISQHMDSEVQSLCSGTEVSLQNQSFYTAVLFCMYCTTNALY